MVDLQAELGISYVFISHDLSVVEYMSDRVGVMFLGKIVEMGSAAAIYAKPMMPYTQALLSATPEVDRGGRERIVLSGDVPSPLNPPSGCPFRTRCWMARDICVTAVRRCWRWSRANGRLATSPGRRINERRPNDRRHTRLG
jgi:oligopeptide/dipeptide ABC transporter ATP-binding protein